MIYNHDLTATRISVVLLVNVCRRVLCLTDGCDNESRTKPHEVAKALQVRLCVSLARRLSSAFVESLGVRLVLCVCNCLMN